MTKKLLLVLGIFCIMSSCKKAEDARIYGAEDGAKPPEQIAQVRPGYTEEARKNNVVGIVRLQAVVRKDGSVDSFKIVKRLGYGLDEAAIETIKTKWRFKPATLEGKPVDFRVLLEISFNLY
jgi:protein TonB